MAQIAPVQNDLGGLSELIGLFKGSSGATVSQGASNGTSSQTNKGATDTTSAGTNVTSGGNTTTSTTKSNITPEGINSLLKSILGGTSGVPGLAEIAMGQKRAGLYNSSTDELLTNDLLTRAAGQAAQLSAGTTTTSTTQNQSTQNQNSSTQGVTNNTQEGTTTNNTTNNAVTTKDPTLNAAGTAAGLLGASLLGPTIGAGLNAAGGTIKDAVFGTGGVALSTGGAGLTGANVPASGALTQAGDYGLAAGSTAGAGLEAGSIVSGAGLGSQAFPISEALLGSTGAAGGALGAETFLASGAPELFSTAGMFAAGDAAAAAGTAGALGSLAAGTDAALAAAGAAEGAGLLETILAVLAWIICTELTIQKRMPWRYYVTGAKVFKAYPQLVKNGYYLWAIPSVRHLKFHPDSAYSKFLEIIFNWRAENIAAHAGVRGARKLWRGAAVTAILYPVCFLLGVGMKLCGIKRNYFSVYVGGK